VDPAASPAPAVTGGEAAASVADAATETAGPGAEGLALRSVLADSERRAVIEALRRARGVRKEAARLLGIDQRNLAYYFRKHGIDPDDLPG
jgi:transcriptional regulator with GAF, ATPase, and Fis domain